MKNSARILASTLALLMGTSFIACGGGKETQTATETGVQTPETTSEEDARLALKDNLPEKDYQGYKFRLLNYNLTEPSVNYIVPDELTGDVVNDAVYNRNLTVESRFNVALVNYATGATTWQDHGSEIQKLVLAGDDAFDTCAVHCIGGPNISLEGVFLNLYDIPCLDFTQPWWSEQMVKEMTVLGQMNFYGGSICYDTLAAAKCFFLNKQNFRDFNVELPYDDVFAGTWTFDKLIALTKDVYKDVNGDGKRDEGDIYGFVTHSSQNGFLVSFDIPVLTKTDDKVLELTVNNQKTYDFVEKMYSFYFESNGVYTMHGKNASTGETENEWNARLFATGHSVISFGHLKLASSTFRESEVEYGIVPFPKWNEEQESYRSFTSGGLMAVPITVADQERTGIIIEAMTCEGYKTVVPTYFGTALKEKYSYDSESGKSLDIINDSLTISFAYIYDNWKGFGHMCGSLFAIDNPYNTFASYYETRLNSAQGRVDLIKDYFESNVK